MANLFALPWRPIVQNNLVVPGAKIYFTLAGTNTASAPFSNSTLTSPRTNPVIADGTGKIPTTYLDPAKSYRVRIYSKNATVAVDTPLEEYDPYVPGVFADASALEPVADAAAQSAASAANSAASAAAALLSILADDVAAGLALPRITPEMYMVGTRVEGTTDDGPALAAMSAAISALDGGAVDFYPGRTYWVGTQTLNGSTPNGTYTFAPVTPYPVEIDSCTKPVVINMNGATIKTLAGKKYGSFNADGSAKSEAVPYYGADTPPGLSIATPYLAMIYVHDCSGQVVIHGGELDGNITAQTIGGHWGDTGYQIDMDGVLLQDNTVGPIVDVYSHSHGRDGCRLDGPGDPENRENGKLRGRFNNNGRQGISVEGAVGWEIEPQCHHNGWHAAVPASSPSAGIDIEPGVGKSARDIIIRNPDIDDNRGAGLLDGGSGSVSNIDVIGGRIVGSVNYSWYGSGATAFRFDGVTIVGEMLNNADDEFIGCRITNEVALSSTGVVYNSSGYLAPQATRGANFKECEIIFEAPRFFANINGPICDSCTFRIAATAIAASIPYGYFRGYTRFIDDSPGGVGFSRLPGGQGPTLGDAGNAEDWWTFEDGGVVTVYPATIDHATGKRIYYGSATYNPPSLAAGAKDTIKTMTVTGVALGDTVEGVSFSVNLAGARIPAWVSAANTVSYYAINDNGANPLDLASGTVRVKVRQS